VFGLVQGDFACARDVNGCYGAPACFGDWTASYVFSLEAGHSGVEIVTHEVEFVAGRLTVFRWMYSEFRGRHGEDQPALAGVDGAEAKDVSKEGADFVRVMGVDEGVESIDHDANLPRPKGKRLTEEERGWRGSVAAPLE
jgi:hypothetical protein